MTVAGQRSGGILGPIQRVFGRGTVSGLSEGQLLTRFVGERDEVAFEAIVSRHGPMVLGICRRLLSDPHDVEDAFQATFLVLVRRAGSLRDRELLASWLYGVALRVATRCRRDRWRRRAREGGGEVDEVAAVAAAEPDESGLGELRVVLDAEVDRLPERFRAPIVLCYFEGLTHDQAAERLGCPVGTVRSRMARARELLRSRLARRGFGPVPMPAPGLALAPASAAMAAISPPVSQALMARTVGAAGAAIARSILYAGTSAPAFRLARGVLTAMTLTRWTTIAAACAILGVVGGGVRVAATQDGAGAKPDSVPRAEKSQTEAPKGEAPKAVVQSSPALKTLEEMQSWIKRWDSQVADWTNQIDRQRNEIDQQRLKIAGLEAELAELKARDRAVVEHVGSGIARPTAAAPPADPARSNPLAQPHAADPAKANPSAQPQAADEAKPSAAADQVLIGPTSIVSISGANDRAVIYSNATGRSRTYRTPQGMKWLGVTFHGDNVTIVANATERAHLVNYNIKTDRWELQDVRGAKEGLVYLPSGGPGGQEHLLPCHCQGTGITQVAILDLDRGAWTVQNLDEPSEGSVVPEINGKLVVYAVGKHVYAYSGEAGRWDTLTLEEPLFGKQTRGGFNTSPLSLQQELAAVSQHGRLHVFTAKEGKWKAINPKD